MHYLSCFPCSLKQVDYRTLDAHKCCFKVVNFCQLFGTVRTRVCINYEMHCHIDKKKKNRDNIDKFLNKIFY